MTIHLDVVHTRPRPVSFLPMQSRLQWSKLKDETFRGRNKNQKNHPPKRGDFNRRGCLCTLTMFVFSARKLTRHFRSLVIDAGFVCFVFGDPQNLRVKSTSEIQDFSILH